MEEPKLDRASFEFIQQGNCLSSSDQYETIKIDYEASLGIDNDEGGFFVLTTDKWSVDSTEELDKLFERIKKINICNTIQKEK